MTASQKLLLRGLCFSLLANCSKLLALWHYHGFTTFVFSDWDEPYYFAIAYEKAAALLSNTLTVRDLYYPHDFLNILLGMIGQLSGCPPIILGTISDFICSFFAYVFLVRLFSELRAEEDYGNEVAAFVVCTLPWLYPIRWVFPAQPIFRGFNTQISFVMFLYALLQFFEMTHREKSSSRRLGILAGLLLYCYFFAWGAFLALAACYTVWEFIYFGKPEARRNLKSCVSLNFYALLVSLPGIFLILYKQFLLKETGLNEGFQTPVHFHPIWFYGPVDLVTLGVVAMALVLFRLRPTVENRLPKKHLLLLLSILSAQFGLMNLQYFVRMRMEPYHFGLFFLYPLVSGLGTSLFLSYGLRSKVLKGIGAFILCSFALFFLGRGYRSALQENPDEQEQSAVFQELAVHTPSNSRILSMPYLMGEMRTRITPYQLIMPTWIKAVARRSIFIELIGAEPEPDAFLKQELFLSWLYRGRMELLTPCPEGKSFELAGDVLEGTGAYEDIARINQCQRVPKVKQRATICDLLRAYHADYILDDRSNRLSDQQDPLPYSEVVWTSPTKNYTLFRFHQDVAIRDLCSNAAESQTSG